jgi:hypothetical protein
MYPIGANKLRRGREIQVNHHRPGERGEQHHACQQQPDGDERQSGGRCWRTRKCSRDRSALPEQRTTAARKADDGDQRSGRAPRLQIQTATRHRRGCTIEDQQLAEEAGQGWHARKGDRGEEECPRNHPGLGKCCGATTRASSCPSRRSRPQCRPAGTVGADLGHDREQRRHRRRRSGIGRRQPPVQRQQRRLEREHQKQQQRRRCAAAPGPVGRPAPHLHREVGHVERAGHAVDQCRARTGTASSRPG